jgi:hypothetical protein
MTLPTLTASELKGFLSRWKIVIGIIVAVATVAGAVGGFVARGIAGEAEKKADVTAQTLLEVSRAVTAVAQTQQSLGERIAEQKGTVNGLLATLNLDPAKLAALKALPRSPKRMPTDSTRIMCGQTWLAANARLDTLILFSITDSCKVKAYLVYPETRR